MERLLILILMVVLLAGCSQCEFMDYKAQYIEEQGISDIEEIEAFEAEPYIEGSIFKGITDGQEYLYYYEGLPGSQKEGTYANGAYTGTVLDVEEGITYDIHKGEDWISLKPHPECHKPPPDCCRLHRDLCGFPCPLSPL